MVLKKCVAMLLAGGQGSRLGVLTKSIAKPAIPFGGKYRIIDFPLSNCANSGIDTVGVLTQYQPLKLNSHIGSGRPWGLDRPNRGVTILQPYMKQAVGEWYSGTANAIYQNIEFIESYHPDYVFILSGDQIYKMDYSRMLEFHKESRADATIAVLEVDWADANRFGIVNTRDDHRICEFLEKPLNPVSNKASMGIYIFNWEKLKRYLVEDQKTESSNNDFGRDIIPRMLKNGERLFAYPFKGYWKDVGTIYSLWEANMDLLEEAPELDLYDPSWHIYSRNPSVPPHFISVSANVKSCIAAGGGIIGGDVYRSILFSGVYIGKDSKVANSILMPNVRIGENTVIENTIIAENTVIGDNCYIGCALPINKEAKQEMIDSDITVIGENMAIPDGIKIRSGSMLDNDSFIVYQAVV